MEPEKKSLEKEASLGNHHFQVPCSGDVIFWPKSVSSRFLFGTFFESTTCHELITKDCTKEPRVLCQKELSINFRQF